MCKNPTFESELKWFALLESKLIFLPPATKLGQGYFFTRVCDSVHGGVCPSACWDTHPLPGPEADTPPGPEADTPLSSACWDTVTKRAVRILLECNFVRNM